MPEDYLIRLPQLGLTMTEGMLVEWSVATGASVSAGDLLYIVETDKIANEIFADRDGILESILVHAEQTVDVGTVLGVWAGGEDNAPAIAPARSTPAPNANTNPSRTPTPATAPNTATLRRIVATPYARNLARQHHITLSMLNGSGPSGRIIARDVQAAVHTEDTVSSTRQNGQVLRGVKKVVAARMLQSQQEIPHFYLTAAPEISELLWLHDSLKQKPGLGHVTLTHWIATAVGLVIADTPLFRTIHHDDRQIVLAGSDVGIAVATDAGLYAPVARGLGAHGLADNAAQIDRLVTEARNGTLGTGSLSGGATTVSNLGGFKIQRVYPLINPGQSSIVGVGRQQSLFRPDDNDAPLLKRELGLVLACDHRVFDGTDGARMLQAIVELLEDPLLIIAQARR